ISIHSQGLERIQSLGTSFAVSVCSMPRPRTVFRARQPREKDCHTARITDLPGQATRKEKIVRLSHPRTAYRTENAATRETCWGERMFRLWMNPTTTPV